MLKTSKRMILTGESVIDEEVVVAFSASIDCENPEKTPTIGQVKKNPDAYMANRAECRADYAAFEDAVFEALAMLNTGLNNEQ